MNTVFLKAEWRKLAIANYVVDKKILYKYIPYKTELDIWNGHCYLSLVGFMFNNTRLKGFKIPFHTHFEEVNLRFYVRYYDAGKWKRGVVFIKEIVPKPALTLVANTVYGENYETMRMAHFWKNENENLTVEYRWKKKEWNSFKVVAAPTPTPIAPGSEEEFITEHYWGYTQISNNKTSEYEVTHPRWDVFGVRSQNIEVDFKNVYGADFQFLASEQPASVFLAEGSAIEVMQGRII